jgi:hypothetical protein
VGETAGGGSRGEETVNEVWDEDGPEKWNCAEEEKEGEETHDRQAV